MWYKKENDEWLEGNKIYFPDGTILEHNHEVEKDGWKWYNNPPLEYIQWLENINNI